MDCPFLLNKILLLPQGLDQLPTTPLGSSGLDHSGSNDGDGGDGSGDGCHSLLNSGKAYGDSGMKEGPGPAPQIIHFAHLGKVWKPLNLSFPACSTGE